MNTDEFKIYCQNIKKSWECLGEANFKKELIEMKLEIEDQFT